MPGSWTSPDRPGARANALVRVAFRGGKRVGVRDYRTFAAQWLACTIPCRRFADTLAGAAARLGADVDRYSFIVVDSHHLLLASLPAHSHGLLWSRHQLDDAPFPVNFSQFKQPLNQAPGMDFLVPTRLENTFFSSPCRAI